MDGGGGGDGCLAIGLWAAWRGGEGWRGQSDEEMVFWLVSGEGCYLFFLGCGVHLPSTSIHSLVNSNSIPWLNTNHDCFPALPSSPLEHLPHKLITHYLLRNSPSSQS
jgi:hypothetical protein